jgi:hypothetical protein
VLCCAQWHSPSAGTSFCHDAFVDFLDYKWAGPYPCLSDLARYVEGISASEPRYSLNRNNCYWFARSLFHILALRHYAFPFVASSLPPRTFVLPRRIGHRSAGIDDSTWKHQDPSSISLVFRFLYYEEWRNGFLLERRVMKTALVLLLLVLATAGGYGIYFLFHYLYLFAPQSERPVGESDAEVPALISVLPMLFVVIPMSAVVYYYVIVRWLVIHLTDLLLRQGTERLQRIFGACYPNPKTVN